MNSNVTKLKIRRATNNKLKSPLKISTDQIYGKHDKYKYR